MLGMPQGRCSHLRTEFLARREGIDYLRCLDCERVFEDEDLESLRSSGGDDEQAMMA
jgi:hypothetical protein